MLFNKDARKDVSLCLLFSLFFTPHFAYCWVIFFFTQFMGKLFFFKLLVGKLFFSALLMGILFFSEKTIAPPTMSNGRSLMLVVLWWMKTAFCDAKLSKARRSVYHYDVQLVKNIVLHYRSLSQPAQFLKWFSIICPIYMYDLV